MMSYQRRNRPAIRTLWSSASCISIQSPTTVSSPTTSTTNGGWTTPRQTIEVQVVDRSPSAKELSSKAHTVRSCESTASNTSCSSLNSTDDDDDLLFKGCMVKSGGHSKKNLHVRFDTIEIREHPRTLGDNPSVKKGPALSLDWFRGQGRVLRYSVDEYERRRSRKRTVALSVHTRRRLLTEVGVTPSEIFAARREASEIKRSRRKHNCLVDYDDTTLAVESCMSACKGILTGRLSDWELDELMRKAQQATDQQE